MLVCPFAPDEPLTPLLSAMVSGFVSDVECRVLKNECASMKEKMIERNR